jgi:hypothetical protein
MDVDGWGDKGERSNPGQCRSIVLPTSATISLQTDGRTYDLDPTTQLNSRVSPMQLPC